MSIEKPTNIELAELLALAEPRRAPMFPDPIRLTDSHIKSLLAEHLGNPPDSGKRRWIEKEVKEAAEYFLNDVALQSRPTLAASVKQLKRIESAACRLRETIGWGGESFETIPFEPVHTWLRQAAEEYRSRVKLPPGVSQHDVPWNYWEAWKLPASIVGIRLLELWAREAQQIVCRAIDAENKSRRETGRVKITKHALRVMVHRLALCWLNAHGTAPGRGIKVVNQPIKNKDQYTADGPFMRFALAFFKCMEECASKLQTKDAGLKKLLRPSRDTIRGYLVIFKARLKGKAGKT